MARRSTGWTCQRSSKGVRCGHKNLPRTRKCAKCEKPRPVRKRPAHMAALDLSYKEYIEINGGEFCGICGAEPVPGRKLDRDHEHVDNGIARGLLCKKCNRSLVKTRYGLEMTPEWLRAAADYLERTSQSKVSHAASTIVAGSGNSLVASSE